MSLPSAEVNAVHLLGAALRHHMGEEPRRVQVKDEASRARAADSRQRRARLAWTRTMANAALDVSAYFFLGIFFMSSVCCNYQIKAIFNRFCHSAASHLGVVLVGEHNGSTLCTVFVSLMKSSINVLMRTSGSCEDLSSFMALVAGHPARQQPLGLLAANNADMNCSITVTGTMAQC